MSLIDIFLRLKNSKVHDKATGLYKQQQIAKMKHKMHSVTSYNSSSAYFTGTSPGISFILRNSL